MNILLYNVGDDVYTEYHLLLIATIVIFILTPILVLSWLIDSSKGYIKDNVQWVHKDVNFMKQSLPQEKFIDYCRKISNFTGRQHESRAGLLQSQG